jgi:hypothetical protein
MKYIKQPLFITTIVLFILIPATRVFSQGPFATGLKAPTKIITAGQSNLLVAETGTPTPNSGRISLVNRATGARGTLIDNLPSAFNVVEHAPSGPSGIKLDGLKLYLTIGQGDSVKPGPRGGLVANPNPATPLNNSVLELTLPADYEVLTSGFALSMSDQTVLSKGAQVLLQNSEGKTMNLRMVANLPDYKIENRPGLPQGNVRPANLFGLEMANERLYVVDASFNQLYRVHPVTGDYFTFATFPSRPNPLPFGPPFVEAVPTNVRLYADSLLVTCFTGFPFAGGLSDIRSLGFDGFQNPVFMDNLTSTMDVLPVTLPLGHSVFYILEFTTNMLAQPMPPGRLTLKTLNDRYILSSTLISPTSIARDADTGNLFITEIFTGNIIRIVPETGVSNVLRGEK